MFCETLNGLPKKRKPFRAVWIAVDGLGFFLVDFTRAEEKQELPVVDGIKASGFDFLGAGNKAVCLVG